ncbi:hypothetical protein KGF54_002343 [Candida jiufengensis]|uniref:uncharacterized protein n=1 Tax=Candida jiufengensis TaxID=497108 RepID=UPI0022240939|nr:uncharacterized protein KGF54_002343 [Candida jiufengensis]KAI5954568.1 hypothetical protein KGF54_002343 [Candida jiufengensis]
MKPNGEKITLAESGWIVQYLIENYDKNNKFKPETLQDANQIGYFLHYSEGTIQPMLVGLLVNHFAVTTAPSQSKELVKQMIGQINRGYYGTELLKNLKYLNNIVIEQKNRGSDFIVGNKLSAADIMLSFPILGAFTRDQMSDNYTNLKNDYPDLYKYFLNLTKLDGWKKAAGKVKDMEKVIIDGKL